MEKEKFSFLDLVEKIGNKIPHPFILFSLLCFIVIVISAIASFLGLEVNNPVTSEVVVAKNLLSADGINFMLQNLVKNFTGFSPLGLVLVMTIGIGLAENVGLVTAFMQHTVLKLEKHPKLLIFSIMLIGVCGSIASDASIVVLPMIAGFIFLSIGRHPLAGIAIGFASTSGGFDANLFIVGTDALLSGISTEAVKIVNPNYTVSILSNWYIMAFSSIILSIVGTFVTLKYIEPRLGKYAGKKIIEKKELSVLEIKGLRWAGVTSLLYILLLVGAVFPKNSFLRNPITGSLLNSPLLNSIVPLILIFFLLVGITYGVITKKILSSADIPKYMTIAMKNMGGYIVLVFVIGQFISYFNWSNLGYILAVKGANLLKNFNLDGIPLFISFILLASFINLFIGSGSAKWSLLAPIFVPMFYMLGYAPSLTQALYRVGDSATNIISPLFPYMPIILGLAQEYDEEVGVGTIISLMLPYSITMLISWTLLTILWIYLGIPLGPGEVMFL